MCAALSSTKRAARACVPSFAKSRKRSAPAIDRARSLRWRKPNLSSFAQRKRTSCTATQRGVRLRGLPIASPRSANRNTQPAAGAKLAAVGSAPGTHPVRPPPPKCFPLRRASRCEGCGLPSICCRIVTSSGKTCWRGGAHVFVRQSCEVFICSVRTTAGLPMNLGQKNLCAMKGLSLTRAGGL